MKHLALILIAFAFINCAAQDNPPPPPLFESEFTCTGTECDLVFSTEDEDDKTIYAFTDQMPEFPGGIDSLYIFLNRNLHYPVEEKRKQIQGTVYVRFIVEDDGSVSSAEVLRGVEGGPGLSDEAVRVISQMPKWNPAKQAGTEVSSYFTLRVKFKFT